MDFDGTALAFSGLGAAALATSVLTLRRRLQLSRAKHRSLAGHARIARRMARLVPFYAYDESRFFCSDGAPAEIAARRRDGFMRLAALYRDAISPRPPGRPPRSPDRISDLQFTDAYRVPFQYSRFVRAASADRRLRAVVRRRHRHRPRRQPVLRPHRLLRRQPVRLRLLQGLHGARARARARARAGARPLSPGGRRQRAAADAPSPASTRSRSTCRAPRR